MKILVTGGAGFIGSNLVQYLLDEASGELGIKIEKVVTLDKLTYAGNRSNLRQFDEDPRHVFVEGDIGNPILVAHLLREHGINAVMHLAAESHVDRSIDNPEEFVMTNFVGTYRLIEEFRRYVNEIGISPNTPAINSLKNGSRVAFLHVSTDEVYGALSDTDPPFCESTPYAPNSPYSASKAGSDHLVRAYHHTYGLPVVTTNCSNNYGPYQLPEKLIPLVIRKILGGEAIPVYGDGSQVRDWLFVKDHCRGLAMALIRGVFGETYVIGGRCEMKNIDVVTTIIETIRELAHERHMKTTEELITYVKDRPGHDRRYAINPARIERELGWQPQEIFRSGIRQTILWYLNNENFLNLK
jgi:dTDP-glucose 4,6-dehydratase